MSENKIPISYGISQNFPNPFNPSTTIKYTLPFESDVKIIIYNAVNEVVKEVVNKSQQAGYHQANFNGSHLASGIYFYSIVASSTDGSHNYKQIKKMILMK
ncbi:MAG: T9SS type A sorting domain-containing protein [Ignavibacteria bacterium]|nr:T9SS type A sorting domain-containing protein [Ignavibacteria bacterium]